MESDGRSSFSTDSARNTENTENTGLQRHRVVKNTETVTGVRGECGEQTGMNLDVRNIGAPNVCIANEISPQF